MGGAIGLEWDVAMKDYCLFYCKQSHKRHIKLLSDDEEDRAEVEHTPFKTVYQLRKGQQEVQQAGLADAPAPHTFDITCLGVTQWPHIPRPLLGAGAYVRVLALYLVRGRLLGRLEGGLPPFPACPHPPSDSLATPWHSSGGSILCEFWLEHCCCW